MGWKSSNGQAQIRRSRKSIPDPRGIPATIQNRIDPNDVFLEAIINREGESFAQQAVISEMEGVNPSIEIERLYVWKERVEKVITESFRLTLIKLETIEQIFLGRVKEFDSHLIWSLILSLARSKAVNFAFPSFISFSLASKTSLCQFGDGIDSGSRHRSSHSFSITAILSKLDILSKGNEISTSFSFFFDKYSSVRLIDFSIFRNEEFTESSNNHFSALNDPFGGQNGSFKKRVVKLSVAKDIILPSVCSALQLNRLRPDEIRIPNYGRKLPQTGDPGANGYAFEKPCRYSPCPVSV